MDNNNDLLFWKLGQMNAAKGYAAAAKGKGTASWSSYWTTREPSDIVVTITSETTATVTWTDSAETGADGYKVYADATLKATVAVGAQTASITGLTAETEYDFKVVAYKGSNESTGITSTETTYYWYNASAVTTAVAAYNAVGAASAAASYVNLKTPGTYNLTPTATAPTWNATTGWKFLTARFFDTGYTFTDKNHTVLWLMKSTLSGYELYWGNMGASYPNNAFYAQYAEGGTYPKRLTANIGGNDAQVLRINDFTPYDDTDVVMAANLNDIFVNGIPASTGGSSVNPTMGYESCLIGAANWQANATPKYYGGYTGYIYAWVVFSSLLTYSQIAEISYRMKLLIGGTTSFNGITVYNDNPYSTTNPID